MTPVDPTLHNGAHRVLFGHGQPEYFPLPASVDEQGCVMTEWSLSEEEVLKLMSGGRVRVWLLHTGINRGAKLTPMNVEIVPDPNPDNVPDEDN